MQGSEQCMLLSFPPLLIVSNVAQYTFPDVGTISSMCLYSHLFNYNALQRLTRGHWVFNGGDMVV